LVEGDAAQLSQAILNICLNGIDAMPGAGVLAMVARDRTLDASSAMKLRLAPGMYVEIAVRDSGSGMDALTSARIFEPFFTTKAGRGTGLGLAMVYGTVKAHRGAIEVESEPGRGTLIRILLPRGDRKGRRTEIPPSNLPLPTRRTGRILVVDDDPLLRSTTKRMLERAGHEVLVAEDGKEALEIFEKTPEIGGILLDMSMPHMGGADCFQALRARDPAVKVVLMSGFARSEEVRASLATGALGFVGKPFSAARLHEAVAALLQGVRLSPEDDGGEDPLT
jgi:CheY-like chemotaxis protein